MEIIDPTIKFLGALKNKGDKNITGLQLKIEYFNVAEKVWTVIIPSTRVARGKYSAEIDLKSDEIRTNETFAPIYQALASGNLPTTRVSLLSPDPDLPAQVIGLGGIINLQVIRLQNVIEIDYGSNWFIEPFNVKREIKGRFPPLEYDLISLPLPNKDNPLFPALQAALNQTERLLEYTVDGHTVFVRPKDDEYEANDAKIKELLDTIVIRDAQLVDERAKVDDLVNALSVEKDKVLEVTKALEAEKLNLLEVKKTLEAAEGKIIELGKALEIERANGIKINEALKIEQGKVAECKVVIERLEAEKIDILTRDATPANEVYKAIVSELETATDESIGGRFAVSNLSLNLKTHIKNDGDGFKLQLIDSARADYVQDGTISEVHLDIISQEPIKNPPTELIMPKVNGLTETATRKRLTAFGLVLNPIYQASTTMTIGQAFKQTPGAGEEVNVGDTITVIFAKDTENFN
ncbi:MAG: PASTA domain-containing protein [Crocinitomix sp.]|nr:PASTA domain-containing protein [Crocinitomix sp.]